MVNHCVVSEIKIVYGIDLRLSDALLRPEPEVSLFCIGEPVEYEKGSNYLDEITVL